MNPEPDKQLADEVDRDLKSLGELPAPDSLIPRVMAVLGQRAEVPWYRRSWPAWPLALRAVSLLVLLAFFAGLCFAGGKFASAGTVPAAIHGIGQVFSGFEIVWSTLNALGNAVVLLAGRLGTGVLIACLAMVALSYAACIGLGTVFMRLAFAQQRN